jgi:hypothetical protein
MEAMGIGSTLELVITVVLLCCGLFAFRACVVYLSRARQIRCREFGCNLQEQLRLENIRDQWGLGIIACGLGLLGVYNLWVLLGLLYIFVCLAGCNPRAARHLLLTALRRRRSILD